MTPPGIGMKSPRRPPRPWHRKPAIVLSPDLKPEGFSAVPCPSSAVAVLGVDEPTRVYCCDIEGHDGSHRFFIEWTDPA